MDLYTRTRFNKAPTISKGRTRFDLSHSILTSFNTGELVPVLCEPVYPSETHSLKTSSLTRLETSLHQTMDNAYVEFAYFFVPDRIIWTDFEKFMGANDDPWTQTQAYAIPQLDLSAASTAAVVPVGSLLHHLAIPAGSYGSGSSNPYLSIDLRPLRCVFQVFNDWYRDENYDSIIYFDKGSTDKFLHNGYLFNGSYFYPYMDMLHVNRLKDLFSTALPAPQKGDAVSFGMTGLAPLAVGDSYTVDGQIQLDSSDIPTSASTNKFSLSFMPGSSVHKLAAYVDNTGNLDYDIDTTNLYADFSKASAVTINQLRLAISAQAIAERNARGGTRMKERIYSTWNVDCADLPLDRSEFLGGKRFPVSMMEVLQTSETGTTVLGSDAGHSKTTDSSESFVRSFTQYGWILGFMYIRTARSYSQGIDRKFRNKSIYDLYDPMLDNIGELPVLKQELYALNTSDATNVGYANEVFGYQEAWYHLKERTNRFSGYFQPSVSGTLDSWHYGDDYSSYPSASASWLKEGSSLVDRTIAVSSNASFQWTANVYFEYYATRTMAKYSIPNTFGF